MSKSITVGLVGNHNPTVVAHRAIPLALERAGTTCGMRVEIEWVPTEEILSVDRVSGFDGIWCVPASPYRSMQGALLAIRHAREQGIPFLGTCGGFQHAVIEYARDVLGWSGADHAETSPESPHAVISPLNCALVEVRNLVRLFPGTRIAAAYGTDTATEGYHCSYGINPKFREALMSGPLRVTAEDETSEIRAIELDRHPFFVATLFQPERAALENRTPPLVIAFVRAIQSRVAQQR